MGFINSFCWFLPFGCYNLSLVIPLPLMTLMSSEVWEFRILVVSFGVQKFGCSEVWKFRSLGFQKFGSFGFWEFGSSGVWSSKVLKFKSSEVRSLEVQKFKSWKVQKFRNSEVQMFRSSEIPAPLLMNVFRSCFFLNWLGWLYKLYNAEFVHKLKLYIIRWEKIVSEFYIFFSVYTLFEFETLAYIETSII